MLDKLTSDLDSLRNENRRDISSYFSLICAISKALFESRFYVTRKDPKVNVGERIIDFKKKWGINIGYINGMAKDSSPLFDSWLVDAAKYKQDIENDHSMNSQLLFTSKPTSTVTPVTEVNVDVPSKSESMRVHLEQPDEVPMGWSHLYIFEFKKGIVIKNKEMTSVSESMRVHFGMTELNDFDVSSIKNPYKDRNTPKEYNDSLDEFVMTVVDTPIDVIIVPTRYLTMNELNTVNIIHERLKNISNFNNTKFIYVDGLINVHNIMEATERAFPEFDELDNKS